MPITIYIISSILVGLVAICGFVGRGRAVVALRPLRVARVEVAPAGLGIE